MADKSYINVELSDPAAVTQLKAKVDVLIEANGGLTDANYTFLSRKGRELGVHSLDINAILTVFKECLSQQSGACNFLGSENEAFVTAAVYGLDELAQTICGVWVSSVDLHSDYVCVSNSYRD